MRLAVHEIEVIKVLINLSVIAHGLEIEILRRRLQRERSLVREALSEVLLHNVDLQLLQERALVTQEVAFLLRG